MADGAHSRPLKVNKLGYRILGVVARAPQSGYDIVKALIKFRPVNVSQVYPIVTEMEAHGLLRSEEIVQSGKPNKKVYHLLEPGRAVLKAWIASPTEPPEPRDEFAAKVYSLWLAPGKERANLIRERLEPLHADIAFFSAKLDELHEACGGTPDDPGTWQFCRHVLMTRRISLYRNEIEWCEALLATLEEPA